MESYNFRLISIAAIAIVIVSDSAVVAQGGKALTEMPPSLKEVVPASVLELSQWSESSAKENGQDSRDKVILEKQGRDWITRVLEPTWQPPADSTAYFLPGQRSETGILRMRWQCNEHDVEVSQTLELFVVRVTPLHGTGTGATADERLAVAKDICLSLFRSTGRRWGPGSSGAEALVIMDDLDEKIAFYSFVAETVRRLNDGTLLGRPKTREQEFINSKATGDVPPIPWNYWFRNVSWWNDGQSVVIFFPKYEGGSRAAHSR